MYNVNQNWRGRLKPSAFSKSNFGLETTAQGNAHSLSMSSHDSLPTSWKSGICVEGPLRITWRERLVREEKDEISFNSSSRSINGIKQHMSSKGWDLKYTTVPNSDDLIVKVPSEFGHSFRYILEDLNAILAPRTKTDL
jgi:hypothetical protein